MRLPPTGGVPIVTRDSTDVPAAGVYSICYVNGSRPSPTIGPPSWSTIRNSCCAGTASR